MTALNATHDPAATSWLASATGSDFPIQNLPFGTFRRAGSDEPLRGGVAIGDQVVCLRTFAQSGAFDGLAARGLQAASEPSLDEFAALGPQVWSALRHALFAALKAGASGPACDAVKKALVPQAQAAHALPTRVRNYTDFYTSLHHATNSGRLSRPDQPVMPNFRWMPIAYHGRASSVVVSGHPVQRPMGQAMPRGADAPVFGPSARLDYELELAIWVGAGNAQGRAVPIDDADGHILGYGLLNDWSARDIQYWEMAPLGPFAGKNFCSTVSPWIVTQEALAPFRLPAAGRDGAPAPLPYLDSAAHRAGGALAIEMAAAVRSAAMRQAGQAPTVLSRTSFRHQYWTPAQMVVQHTVGGCNLLPGDLLGSGTVSGPTPPERGCLLELTQGGRDALALASGEERRFLEDGDEVVLTAWCEKPGAVRIGFGECRGVIEAAA